MYTVSMTKFIKKQRTNNILLRLIGNISGSIFTFFLLKEIRCEKKNHKLRAKIFAKMGSVFERLQDKWATYYISSSKNKYTLTS